MIATVKTPKSRLPGLDDALSSIAHDAAGRDAQPRPSFPASALDALGASGALSWNALPGRRRPPAGEELSLVRGVARADSSVGRIFDGHLNAVERLLVQGPRELVERELPSIRAGRLWAGVWGGDPVPGEGPPAALVEVDGREVLRGVKTFCSGAGGLHRALVLARSGGGGPPISVWVDLTDPGRVEVDEDWYRGMGLRASVSHRVLFHDAPVLARFGGPGAIAEQPWFGRDALRTAVSWAGMADSASEDALHELALRPQRGQIEGLAAGRILTAQRSIDLWIGAAAAAMDGDDGGLAEIAVQARVAIADASRMILEEAARGCGSRPFAHGGTLERVRRDLEVFLLQHRLEPLLARSGETALSERAP
jgi:alkylation response protein AidB-like acyl-CoA dehydrogenase